MGAYPLATMSAEFELAAMQGDLGGVQAQLDRYLNLYTATHTTLGEVLKVYGSSG